MVEVCGVKYMKGTSKSGKPYEAYSIHYTEDGASQGYDGYVTGDAFISIELLGGMPIRVGDKVEISYRKNSSFVSSVKFVNG